MAGRLIVPSKGHDTYSLKQRPAPRARRATCAEAGCEAYLNGWRTVLAADDGARQAYIRGDRTRRHVEHVDELGRLVFTFEAGQTCFGEHWIELQQLYLVREGRGGYHHHSPAGWVDRFGENQQRLQELRQRG